MSQLQSLDDALKEVRQKSLAGEPVAGLLWMALVMARDFGDVGEIKGQPLLDLARELSAADTSGRRHHPFSEPEINVLLSGFPSLMQAPVTGPFGGAVGLRLELLGVDSCTFGCRGIGGGSLKIDTIDVQGWTPMGLALRARHLDGELDQRDPDWAYTRIREFQSLLPMKWVREELLVHPLRLDPAPASAGGTEQPRRGLHAPFGTWAPAYTDGSGQTHEAFDFLAERMAADGVAWLTTLAIEVAGPDAGAALAGRHAARLHDLAVDDYRPLRSRQNFDGKGLDLPIGTDSLVHRSIGRMIGAGAHLTAAQWGGGRTFGAQPGAANDIGLVSCLFSDQPGLWNDDKRLAGLRRLYDMGHDVVVAHVNEDHRSRSFSMLPLYACLGADQSGCVVQLLDWGADEKASVHNLNEGGTTLALAQSIEADFPDRTGPSVLRAALARRQALMVLNDCVDGRDQGPRP